MHCKNQGFWASQAPKFGANHVPKAFQNCENTANMMLFDGTQKCDKTMCGEMVTSCGM